MNLFNKELKSRQDPVKKTSGSRTYHSLPGDILSEWENSELQDVMEKGPSIHDSREIIGRFLSITGSEALNRILDFENPGRLVRSMTRVDLFWLIKKIGEEDSLPLLRLASEDQWQYILDMELWHRDRIGLKETFEWLNRLHDADPARLARWLFSEDGILLAQFYFYKSIQVLVKNEAEDTRIPEGFNTFDGLIFFHILDKEHEETIEQFLQHMADEDYPHYQSLLLRIAGVIPSEVEEEMYRLKSVRLAEDGYLPFEEAISVYSHQKAEHIKRDRSEYMLFLPEDEDEKSVVPIMPLVQTQGNRIFGESIARITDHLLLDRLRLEFAGLCNQIFSADGVRFEGIEVLERVCGKASGYINIGLEILSDNNLEMSLQFLRNNPLLSIFRVGFGRALEVKWEADKWIKRSWFMKMDLRFDFWGDSRGGILRGIVMHKPLFYDELSQEEYRDFESLSEVEDCRILIRRLALLDRVMETITSHYPCDMDKLEESLSIFYPVILNFWARKQLNLNPGFIGLSLDQAKEFFRLIRHGSDTPPFRMEGFEERFIRDISSLENMACEPGDTLTLKEALSIVWQEFRDEYAMVNVKDLDARFAKFLFIRSSS